MIQLRNKSSAGRPRQVILQADDAPRRDAWQAMVVPHIRMSDAMK